MGKCKWKGEGIHLECFYQTDENDSESAKNINENISN